MSKEAMKLALEALEADQKLIEAYRPKSHTDRLLNAIKALEEALANQEHGEPVAWGYIDEYGEVKKFENPSAHKRDAYSSFQLIYTTPQQRKPLTDEQDAFEAVFKLPENCTRFEGGYAPTSYNAWDAQTFCARWEGWKARASHGIKE